MSIAWQILPPSPPCRKSTCPLWKQFQQHIALIVGMSWHRWVMELSECCRSANGLHEALLEVDPWSTKLRKPPQCRVRTTGLMQGTLLHGSLKLEHGSLTLKHGSFKRKHGSLKLEHGSLKLEHGSLTLEHRSLKLEHGSLKLEHGFVKLKGPTTICRSDQH